MAVAKAEVRVPEIRSLPLGIPDVEIIQAMGIHLPNSGEPTTYLLISPGSPHLETILQRAEEWGIKERVILARDGIGERLAEITQNGGLLFFRDIDAETGKLLEDAEAAGLRIVSYKDRNPYELITAYLKDPLRPWQKEGLL